MWSQKDFQMDQMQDEKQKKVEEGSHRWPRSFWLRYVGGWNYHLLRCRILRPVQIWGGNQEFMLMTLCAVCWCFTIALQNTSHSPLVALGHIGVTVATLGKITPGSHWKYLLLSHYPAVLSDSTVPYSLFTVALDDVQSWVPRSHNWPPGKSGPMLVKLLFRVSTIRHWYLQENGVERKGERPISSFIIFIRIFLKSSKIVFPNSEFPKTAPWILFIFSLSLGSNTLRRLSWKQIWVRAPSHVQHHHH